jgi:chromate transporter
VGGLLAVMGIFLPGTFLIFFVSKFWEDVKRYRVIKASLEGINAVSSGLVIAATLYLLEPIPITQTNYALIFITLIVLFFTKVPTPFIILAGLAMGFIVS